MSECAKTGREFAMLQAANRVRRDAATLGEDFLRQSTNVAQKFDVAAEQLPSRVTHLIHHHL